VTPKGGRRRGDVGESKEIALGAGEGGVGHMITRRFGGEGDDSRMSSRGRKNAVDLCEGGKGEGGGGGDGNRGSK